MDLSNKNPCVRAPGVGENFTFPAKQRKKKRTDERCPISKSKKQHGKRRDHNTDLPPSKEQEPLKNRNATKIVSHS